MKRLISAALTLSLLGATAAVAAPYDHGNSGGYSQQDRGDYRRGDNSAGMAIGLGIGLFALAAIASQHHDHNYDRYDNRGYGGGYGGSGYYNQTGYAPAYDRGYASTYGHGGYDNNRRGGYDNNSRQGYDNNGYRGYGGR